VRKTAGPFAGVDGAAAPVIGIPAIEPWSIPGIGSAVIGEAKAGAATPAAKMLAAPSATATANRRPSTIDFKIDMIIPLRGLDI
jgi:hypothetical protein